ncbi:MAG: LptF/LptG family permease [Rickettsiales bacterium]|jgi:lipopolysaccharide export LptBFGC system permease protein LptF|nr:LptF/LptG family permease [Rickettsiales bacterium]
MIIDRISFHIVSEFLKMFLLVFFVVSTIVFVVNFLEFFPNIQSYSIPPRDALRIVIFKIPWVIEPILQFIVLLSVTFIMTKFLAKNELVILYSNGISDWKILRLLSCTAFLLGIGYLMVYNRGAVNMLKKSETLLKKYKGVVETSDFMRPSGGIWLRHSGEKHEDNGENPEGYEIITKADSVFVESLVFNGIILLVSDENGNFLRRINAESMQIVNGRLVVAGAHLIEQGKDITFLEKIVIPVVANDAFVRKQIQNKYKNPETVDFLSLGSLIEDFRVHGLNTRRFEIRRNNLILVPAMYILMVFIGVLFSGSNPRDTKHMLRTLNVSLTGVCIFVLQNVLTGLALTGTVNYLFSTWGFAILALVLAYVKLIGRIELQNL